MIESIRNKAIEIYGGYDLWDKAKSIVSVVSVSGLLFTLKRRPVFKKVTIELDINRFYSKITPIGANPDISGVFDNNKVYLQNQNGKILEERQNPRKYFPYRRRLLYWDDLDFSYFANYAFWNYFAFPKILMNENIKWNEIDYKLEALFPDYFPTHSRKQLFIFDKQSGRLMQHNYTAEVVSGLATAANVVKEHKFENGVLYAAHRVVTPQSKSKGYLQKPVLVDDYVHSMKMY